jgi:hypothetical protein
MVPGCSREAAASLGLSLCWPLLLRMAIGMFKVVRFMLWTRRRAQLGAVRSVRSVPVSLGGHAIMSRMGFVVGL